jgi:predicted secreted protein
MNTELGFLTAAIASVAWWACRRKGGLELNHVLLASIGFGLYCILPPWLTAQSFSTNDIGLRSWQEFVLVRSDASRLQDYLRGSVLAFASFAVGSVIGGIRTPPPRLASLSLTLRFAPIGLTTLAAGMVFAAYAWRMRGQLFTGYLTLADENLLPRGTITALSLPLTALLLFDLLRSWGGGEQRPRSLVRSPIFAIWLVANLILLGLGGRLYVVSGVLAIGVFVSLQRRPISLRAIVLSALLVAVVSGLYGMIRLGESVTADGVLRNLASEPLFTSFSLFNFLGRVDPPRFAWPRFLLGDLVNLVPTVVMPNKAALLVQPDAHGYPIFSPLGALHAYVSWVINFGSVGMVLAIGFGGYLLSRLRLVPHHAARVAYAMASAFCTFSVFRDPFSISLVKNVLEFSLIVPIALWIAFRAAALVVVRWEPSAAGTSASHP